METRYIGKNLTDKQKQQIWELLLECDEDFCPPLSYRANSWQKDLSGGGTKSEEGPREYYEAMCQQHFIVCMEGEEMAGFLTFKEPYTCPELSQFGESLYLTTMCITHPMRGKGITGQLYGIVENGLAKEMGYDYITLRTWSTNGAQMHLLPKRGYREVAVIKNDRGEGVDTIYFVKEA